MDDREPLAERLLATFLDELEEQRRTLDATLLEVESGPPDPQRVRVIFRVMHTLKGAARAAGVRPIEEICHALETRLIASRDAGALRGDEIPLLFAASDALADAGKRLRAGERLDSGPLLLLSQQLSGLVAAPSAPAAPTPLVVATPTAEAAPAAPSQSASPGAPNVDARADSHEQMRLGARQVDALVGAAGDLSAASSAAASRPATAAELYDALLDWRREWRHARSTVGAAIGHLGGRLDVVSTFDRLDAVVGGIARDAARLTREMTDDARALSATTMRLQDHVRRLRMRPFGDAVESLPRAARDVAVHLQKEVRLVVEGQTVEADRAVLDALRDPLLQLVRNAVDHGIEPPSVRTHAGKPAAGTVAVRATAPGDSLIVTVSDDGAGIDTTAVRSALARRGTIAPQAEADVARSILDGGLSTRTSATTISGRGVGLDIVRATVDRLGGSVDVTSQPGIGTTFTLEVPVSSATLRALLVRVGDVTLGIPATAVQRTLRFRPDAVKTVQGQVVLPTREASLAVVPLARALGLPATADQAADGMMRGVIIEHAQRRAVVVVDDITDVRELVVRPIEHVDRRTVARFAGGALLDATHVALIVNPLGIIGARGEVSTTGSDTGSTKRPRILVVDDSITTRTLEQSVLSAAGYDVVTAVDGLDGWRLIEAGGVDLVMTDVEMPRLDGIGLCERIRASSTYTALPVVMVTSLDRPDERARGLEAGADAYVTKSSFDQDTLLDIVAQLLEDGR